MISRKTDNIHNIHEEHEIEQIRSFIEYLNSRNITGTDMIANLIEKKHRSAQNRIIKNMLYIIAHYNKHCGICGPYDSRNKEAYVLSSNIRNIINHNGGFIKI